MIRQFLIDPKNKTCISVKLRRMQGIVTHKKIVFKIFLCGPGDQIKASHMVGEHGTNDPHPTP